MSAPRPHEALAALRALEDLASSDPLELRGEPITRISRGALSLNDPSTANVCLATFEVKGPASSPSRRGPWEKEGRGDIPFH